MKLTWAIIGVGDVASSLRWHQSLFGQPETPSLSERITQRSEKQISIVDTSDNDQNRF